MANDTPDQNSAPPMNTPAPTSLPAPPDITTSGPANAPSSLPIAPAPSAAAPPPPRAGQDLSDPNAHHNVAEKVLSTLAGGKPTAYVQTDKGPVPVKTDWKPGELAKHIVASAASLIAAGSGGILAAKQKRPFELAPGTSLGEIEDAGRQKAQQQAQQQFENTRQANEATLRAHRDAMEQQENIAKLQNYSDQHQAAVQARSLDPLRNEVETRNLNNEMFQQDVKNAQNYSQALAMPGATVMKDANGQELNFASGEEAKAYVVAHPNVIHGSTNGNTKFGVIPVINPSTGAYQLIDYPADRHDVGITNFGQKKDEKGNPVFDKDGNPVPDGTVLDPKTKKPTVLTQTVTPDQARAIAAQNITQANIIAQMNDRDAQARLRDSQVKKNEELQEAVDAYNMGNFDKMTDRQKQLVARMTFQEQTLASNREKTAEANLARVRSTALNDDDPAVKDALAKYNEAKTDYDDAAEKYNQLTGNTAGVQLGNQIIRKGIGNTPWNQINQQILSAPIADDEKQVALARVWNSLSPAQRDAVKTQTLQDAQKSLADALKAANNDVKNPAVMAAQKVVTQAQNAIQQAQQTGAAAGTVVKKQPAQPPAEGQAVLWDPQGNPHTVAANLVDQYLANPSYKGWSK